MNNKEKYILSKTSFLRGMQCLKSLYFHRHSPELRDKPDSRYARMSASGDRVGLLARGLFPGGVEACSPGAIHIALPGKPAMDGNAGLTDAVKRTRNLIEANTPVIYEAAFLHDGIMCLVDILVKDGDAWKAFEVKSSSRVSEAHLLDAALQYYVITGTGMLLRDIAIVHINSRYVLHGELDLSLLFRVKTVREKATGLLSSVESAALGMRKALEGAFPPDCEIGEQCVSPRPCDFRGQCWSHVPRESVFEITGLSIHDKFGMYRAGMVRMQDIPGDYPLKSFQKLQVKCAVSGATYTDREALNRFLAEISYPLYFMDFETIMPAIPRYDGTAPYGHVPFQYSLHYLESRGSNPVHREFLAVPGKDPRRDFITSLLEDTSAKGDILVYNRSFEEGVLKELAGLYPELRVQVEERIARLRDLMLPFRFRHYYSPAMKGRFSIKKVLPALAPEYSYEELEISDGFMAMSAYERLDGESDPVEIERVTAELRRYCALDTRAMMIILKCPGRRNG